jgi:HSP20 family molecular chaperone IbpA
MGDGASAFRRHARDTEVLGHLGAWPWARIALGPGTGLPAVDVIDRPSEFVVRADLPGLEREDVQVIVEPRTLHLRGVRGTDAGTTPGDLYQCVERWSGPFARAIRLPAGVDPDQSTVTLAHGVLEVHLPKRAQATTGTVDLHREEAASPAETGEGVGGAVFKEPACAA